MAEVWMELMDRSEIMDFGGVFSKEKADFVPKGLVDIFGPFWLLTNSVFLLMVLSSPPGKGRKGKKISKTSVTIIPV